MMTFRPRFSVPLALAGIGLAAASALAASGQRSGWMLEPGTANPSYAMIEPASTDLNIDTVLLACEEEADGRPEGRFVQLQFYQTEEGFLAPVSARSGPTKEEPRADLTIDGQHFAVSLAFGENYAALGDEGDPSQPRVSDRLLRALESGKTLTVRTDLLAEPAGPPAFDSITVVNLQSPGKVEAMRAMRRCTERVHAARPQSAKR
jgi:hypothetical protein